MSQNVTQLRVALMQQLGEVEAAAREWGCGRTTRKGGSSPP
ncbi:hypothetical protein ACFQY5_41535 [Paeniroseomonas aquatica]